MAFVGVLLVGGAILTLCHALLAGQKPFVVITGLNIFFGVFLGSMNVLAGVGALRGTRTGVQGAFIWSGAVVSMCASKAITGNPISIGTFLLYLTIALLLYPHAFRRQPPQ